MKILIVDDNADNIEMMAIMLRSQKYDVVSAYNGQEALDVLKKEQVDLIISDILMPVMDGFQFCRECKKDEKLCKIYFVFYTATYLESNDEKFAIKLGAQKFFRKPMEPDVFIKNINEVVDIIEQGNNKELKIVDNNDKDVFKLYSERLVHKLEKKNLDLEKEIAAHKETMSKLRQSEERFALAVEGTLDGLWDWNIENDTAYYSERFAEMLGYQHNELPFSIKSWEEMIHPDDFDNYKEKLKSYLERKTDTLNSIFRIKTKDGTIKWFNSRGKALFDQGGIPYRLVGFHSDITDKKMQEFELVNALEKAKESDLLKTAFLQNMSHEIRTPINGILGFAQLLKEGGLNEEDIAEYADIIMQSGYRLIALINNILDISKIDTKRMDINVTMFNLNEFIDEIHFSFDMKIRKQNLIIKKITPLDNDKCNVFTDKAFLKQIFYNLVENALKFTKKGFIELGYSIDEDVVLFYIKDTGIGIAPKYQQKIFDRFFQIDTSLARDYEGTGLGLPIVQGLVELLNGKIWLESEVGKGSTFYFTIPNKNLSDKVVKDSIISTNDGKKQSVCNILVAEDEDVSYYLIFKSLKSEYVKLTRAYNGLDAVEICKSNDIDLVLMDLKMPIMDGIEATVEILKFKPDMKIIAQTAFAYDKDKEAAMVAGCVDFISKPINVFVLKSLISKYAFQTF